MTKLILFLIRIKLGVKKNQDFKFKNQKHTSDYYYISDTAIYKVSKGKVNKSNVSVNWMLDQRCELVKMDGGKA